MSQLASMKWAQKNCEPPNDDECEKKCIRSKKEKRGSRWEGRRCNKGGIRGCRWWMKALQSLLKEDKEYNLN